MRPIICVFDTGAGPKLIRDDVVNLSRLDCVRHGDMPEIRRAWDTRLNVSGTITLYLRMGESRTLVTFDVMDRLDVPVLLQTSFKDYIIKSIHLAERMIFTYRSPPVRILKVHEAKREAEKNSS